MTLRTTMANLITTLRGFTNAGTADFTIGSTAYWSDEQLQDILDRNSVEIVDAAMVSTPELNTSNETIYKRYKSYYKWMESTQGGTARFIVTDGLGNISASSGYTPDYENGRVTFDDDQAGSARYVTGYSYDVYGAAAEIWEQKASQYATMIDFSTDNHNIKRSHIVANCEKMAKKYNAMSDNGGSYSVDIMRGDANVT